MIKFNNPFKKKKKTEEIPREEELQPGEDTSRRFEDFVNEDERERKIDSDPSFDSYRETGDFNPFSGSEQKIDTEPVGREARSGRRLKGGLVAGIAAAIAICTVGYTAYNFMKPKDYSIIKNNKPQETATANVSVTPGAKLPSSYSELAKYEEEQKRLQREELIKSGKLNPAREQMQAYEKKKAAERAAQQAAQQQQKAAQQRTPSVTPPSRPSLPQGQGVPVGPKVNPYAQYNNPVGFSVTESGKVSGSGMNSVFKALPGTNQATGKKYTLNVGTVIPVTLLTGMTSDAQMAGVTAQVRQDVYDSLTGTHLLIPQGSKIVGTGGGKSGKRMNASFTRIILPNGASIKLSGPHATDGQGYTGLRDKYDEKWGPTIKGAFLAGIFTGIADWVGDIDTKTTAGGGVVQSAWGNIAEKVSDRIGEKAEALDKNQTPAAIIRPGFQFHVYLTEDIEVYAYKPLANEPR